MQTHILVAIGSALAMIVSIHGFSDVIGKEGFELDPSRVASQVISGVGFLGAGTILFLKQQVIKGLTTAAALWTVAAVGLAAGGGMYVAATATTLLMLFVLYGIKQIERKLLGKQEVQCISIVLRQGTSTSAGTIAAIFEKHGVDVKRLMITKDEHSNRDHLMITFSKFSSRALILQVMQEMNTLEGIIEIDL